MRSLNTQFGGTLKASDLNAISKQVMRANLAAGKGIVSGLEIASGTGLKVNVSAGEFIAQVQDEARQPFTTPVPANYEGYLWIQGNDNPADQPECLIQATDADPGSTFVCLGHFVSGANSVTVDEAGRKLFGWRTASAGIAGVQAQIEAAVPKFRTETPAGAIDGQNMAFELSFVPIHGGLTLNVTGFDPGDYSVDGTTVTFDMAPPQGATIKAQYPYL